MVSISGIFFSKSKCWSHFQVQAVGFSVYFSTTDAKPQGPPFPAVHSAFFWHLHHWIPPTRVWLSRLNHVVVKNGCSGCSVGIGCNGVVKTHPWAPHTPPCMVYYIYLHWSHQKWTIHVGKYTIHWASGYTSRLDIRPLSRWNKLTGSNESLRSLPAGQGFHSRPYWKKAWIYKPWS